MLSDILLASIMAASTPQELNSLIDSEFKAQYNKKTYYLKSKEDIKPNSFTECYEVVGTRQNHCFYNDKLLDTIVVKLNAESEADILKLKIDESLAFSINNRGQKRWVTNTGKIVFFNYPYFLITVQ